MFNCRLVTILLHKKINYTIIGLYILMLVGAQFKKKILKSVFIMKYIIIIKYYQSAYLIVAAVYVS